MTGFDSSEQGNTSSRQSVARRRRIASVLFVGIAAIPAMAQQVNPRDVLQGFALRDSFRDRRAVNRSLFGPRLLAERPLDYILTTGFAYSNAGEGVRTTSLPQELEIDFNPTATAILIDIDAYDWVRAPATNLAGVGDPSFSVVQSIPCNTCSDGLDSDSLALSAGVTVPSGTDVSGGTAGQTFSFSYGHRFDLDLIKLKAQLDHLDRPPLGTSPYVTTGTFYYQHKFSEKFDAFANIDYSYQSGAGGVTVAGAGVDFSICDHAVGPFKKVGGTLSGTCSLSGSHHCGRVELDVVLPFN